VIREGIVKDITYDVVVVPVSGFGRHKEPESLEGFAKTITIQGRTERPGNVTNLRISRVGDMLYLRWGAVTDEDLQEYEIRYGPSSWATATLIGSTRNTEFATPLFASGVSAYYQVKAVNTSGIYSLTAAFVQSTLEGRLNKNIIIAQDEVDDFTEPWSDGTKSDMTASGVLLSLDVQQTDPALTGSYETSELDCLASVRPLVTCFTQLTQDDLNLTWTSATYSWDSAQATNTTWEGVTSDTEGEPTDRHITSTLKFRYGDSSGALGDYEEFSVGEYSGQYFQFKLEVETDSASYGANVEEMRIELDVKDIFASGENITVSGSGSTTITFGDYSDDTFNVVPDFVAIPRQNVGTDPTVDPGDFVEVIGVTKDSATVRYYNGSGVQEEGQINFIARGY
jgi:hypothetical protein